MQEATQRQRRQRSDTGPRITDRDIKALTWIAQQYAISLDHLSLLLARLPSPAGPGAQTKQAGALTTKRAMEIVKRWETLGLVEKAWILHGQPPWVWVTHTGLQLIASKGQTELRPYTPSAAKLEHIHQTNRARIFIEARRQDAIWYSERTIAAGIKAERGKRQAHRPDAVVRLDNGRHIAVEIELTNKTRARLNAILSELATSTMYHTVWYFTRDRTHRTISDLIEANQDYKTKFAVYDLNSLEVQGGRNNGKAN